MSPELETIATALAAGSVVIGGIAAYTIQSIKATTGGIRESINGLRESVNLLREELRAMREASQEHSSAIAVLMSDFESRRRG